MKTRQRTVVRRRSRLRLDMFAGIVDDRDDRYRFELLRQPEAERGKRYAPDADEVCRRMILWSLDGMGA